MLNNSKSLLVHVALFDLGASFTYLNGVDELGV